MQSKRTIDANSCVNLKYRVDIRPIVFIQITICNKIVSQACGIDKCMANTETSLKKIVSSNEIILEEVEGDSMFSDWP